MKRLGIFVFYDKDGIVDNYVECLLRDVCENVDRLIIVCNGFLSESGSDCLKKYTSEFLTRNNLDYDGGAYKYVFENYLTSDDVKGYDEILMFNDTFFGPFYKFKQIFNIMSQKSYDFWGLSIHEAFKRRGKVLSRHIQSYFIVVSRKVFLSDVFWRFWRRLGHSNSFDEAVINFEISFSKTLMKHGFLCGAYYINDKYIAKKEKDNFDYMQLLIGEAVIKHDFPVFKWKCFFNQTIDNDEARKALEYIYQRCDYPFDNIWQTLFRRNSLLKINETFGLNHLFKGRLTNLQKRIGVIWDVPNENVLKIVFDIIKNKKISRFVIIADNKTKKAIKQIRSENIDDILFLPRHVDAISFLKNNSNIITDCDIWGIFNDEFQPGLRNVVGEVLHRNYLYGDILLNNSVIDYLNEAMVFQPTLKLFLPQQLTNEYKKNLTQLHGISKRIKDYLCKKGMVCEPIDAGVLGVGGFWCETNVLQKCVQVCNHGEEKIWRLSLPYIVKSMNYGVVILNGVDALTTTLNGYVSDLLKCHESNIARKQHVNDVLLGIESVIHKPRYYIYGCGKIAMENVGLLKSVGRTFFGYIVSDGEICKKTIGRKKVIHLSDFQQDENCVVLVSVGKKFLSAVMRNLKKANVYNVIYL